MRGCSHSSFFANARCRKEDEPQLPPETTVGAGIFGCKVNGRVYIPKGYDGTGTPNPKVSLQSFNGNLILVLSTNQFEVGNSIGYVNISIADAVLSTGIYTYPDKMNFTVGWPKIINDCFTPAFDTTVKKWGDVIVTRFDNIDRIVSGKFNCKFMTKICDTIRITDGRFDFKF